MTQFILIKAQKRDLYFRPLAEDFLLEIAKQIFPDFSREAIFKLDVAGKDIDYLLLEAQRAMIESLKFEDTLLFRVMSRILPNVEEFIFWYGADYSDLELISDFPSVLQKIATEIQDLAGELYLHYQKSP